MVIGVALVGLSYWFVLQKTAGWVEFGVACFVVGGALTALNLKLLVNEHFDKLANRQRGNSVLQWTMNLGSFFGVLGLSLTPITISLTAVYWLSFIELFLCFLVYLLGQPFLFSKPVDPDSFWCWLKFFIYLVALLLLAFALARYSEFTRFFVVVVFLVVTIYLLRLAKQQKNHGYYAYLVMVLLGGGGYWLAVAIFQTSFPVFLHEDVANHLLGVNLSSLSVLMVDPIANMFVGGVLLWLYRHWVPSAFTLLIVSMVFNLVAFVLLALSTYFSADHQVALVWPVLSICFYAGAEFLLITTLVSQVAHLVDYKWRGFFLGYNRIAASFYIVLIFYFIKWTKHSGIGLFASKLSNQHLFILMAGFIAVFLVAFIVCCRRVGLEK